MPHINPTDREGTGDFLGAMFAEITGEGGERPKGIVLTPTFLTDFMTDLEKLNYIHVLLFLQREAYFWLLSNIFYTI